MIALLAFIAMLVTGCEKKPTPVPASNAAKSPPGQLTIEYEVMPSLLIEAESGKVRLPVTVCDDPSASGGKYIIAPEGPDHKEISIGGDVTYAFEVARAGEYWLWLRARWSGACGNSVGVSLDGPEIGTVEDAVYDTWHWVAMQEPLRMGAGKRLLVLTNREDGAAVDQVLLTQDADYRPAGVERPDVAARSVAAPYMSPSILIEAETGKLYAPAAAFDDAAASGGKYVLSPEGPDHKQVNTGGGAIYRLPVREAGDYKVWVRARWCCAEGNSLGIKIDGQEVGPVEDGTFGTWHWVAAPQGIRLFSGEHRMVVVNTEDGAAYDQILLTQNLAYVPSDVEPPKGPGRTLATPDLESDISAKEVRPNP